MFVCAYMWARTYYDACELVRQLVEFVLSFLHMGFRDQIRLSGLGTGTFMALSYLEAQEYSKIISNRILKPRTTHMPTVTTILILITREQLFWILNLIKT